MTTSTQSTVTGPLVNLTWITRQAERQVGQLDNVDQAKIAAALVRSLPRNRCELVDNLAQYRVYHFRASKTLRISYRPTERGLCVIHVGTHSQFDRFARHFAGQSPTNLVPLQESQIMTSQQHVRKNGAAKALSTQASLQQSHQPADEDEQMLVESLREVITKVVGSRHDSLASDWTARLDAVRRDVEQTVQEFARKIAQQDSRLNSLAGEYNGKLADVGQHVDEISKNHRELSGLLALVRSDVEERCASLGHALEEVRAEVARHAVQASVTRNEVEHRVTALNSQVEERAREIGLRLDSLAGMVESHRATNETSAAGLKARVVAAEQTLGSLNQVLQRLAATVQTQQETITGLQEALSHVSAQLEPLTAPAANGRSWRRILDWARGLCWRSAQTAFRRP